MIAGVSFQGEYKIGESEWHPIVQGEHIPADQGDVTIRGVFLMHNPETGEVIRPLSPGNIVSLYFNHIGGTAILPSGGKIPFDAENPYISVFNGSTVYSAKVTEALKITQAQVDDGTLFNAIQTGTTAAPACIYLAENIDLASYISENGWQPTTPFIGTFDGGNQAIDNLTTNNGTNYGFFRRFTGTLKNVAFTNVTMNANSGVISDRFVENTETYIENVFIKVTKTGNSSSSARYGAITERADKTGHVTLTNVVVSMPGTAPNESLFGNSLRTTAHINDVYTIGLKTTQNFPYTENSTLNTPPEVNEHAYYADLTAFTKGTKTLTPFLQSVKDSSPT